MNGAKYDAVIIGAGMSGMAAGIRLAMFGKRALILEKHSIPGGLNSYYRRGQRQFDVGLHALTNFAVPGERRRPLNKLLKQLRIPHAQLELCRQNYSLIQFPQTRLRFNNDITFFTEEVATRFPSQVDGFTRLIKYLGEFDETALGNPYRSAKEVVGQFLSDPLLLEMLFCPLLIYGSAREDDMDFSQFAIMFKSLYLEGFSRPKGGVRRLIGILMQKLEENGCEVRFQCGVRHIVTAGEGERVKGVVTQAGEFIASDMIFSSAGMPETHALLDVPTPSHPSVGKLSFTESLLCLKERPGELQQEASIIFYNNRSTYHYRRPEVPFDPHSAVVCFPNNFAHDDFEEGLVRVTFIANYHRWKALLERGRLAYGQAKGEVLKAASVLAQKFLPRWDGAIEFSDVFTPTTITRYTGHLQGCVYGSPDKRRDGHTAVGGLVLCGTDQGFLGIVGSLLSGISMANLHGLSGGERG